MRAAASSCRPFRCAPAVSAILAGIAAACGKTATCRYGPDPAMREKASDELSSGLYRRRPRLDAAPHSSTSTCARCLGTAFPYGTFIINITGSIVMGLIAGYLAFKGEASQPWRLFLMTGILGGYTTFSAFSLDAALLYERGEIGLAAVLRAGIGGAVDRRPVRRPRAGAPSRSARAKWMPVRVDASRQRPSAAWASMRRAWMLPRFRLLRCAGETKQGQPHHAPDPLPCQNSPERPGARRRRRGRRAASRAHPQADRLVDDHDRACWSRSAPRWSGGATASTAYWKS